MKVAILQSNYLPWKGYFELINNADVFCFYDEVQYTKNDWRNRNKIVGTNGPFWLTIPIEKEAVKQKISEVKYSNTIWVKKHLTSISQSYSKSPCYKDVRNVLERVFLEAEFLSLSELNQTFIKEICKYIGIDTKFQNSADFNLQGGRVERLINLISELKVSEYISGPSAKNYLLEDIELFEISGIKLSYIDYGPYKRYSQSLDNFEDYVSIVDVLMRVPQNELLDYIISQG